MTSHQLTTTLALLCTIVVHSYGGITSSFVRSPLASSDIPIRSLPPPLGHNAPEQVHITQGDYIGRSVIVSWVTPLAEEPNNVTYWAANKAHWKVDEHKHKPHRHHNHHKHHSHRHRHTVNAKITTYRYAEYTSGYIHHATIHKLQYDTKYIYEIGNRTFSFTTPPEPGPDVPYTFGIIGDLGQTYDSNQTLEHYVSNPKAQAVLFAGDLSYADHYYHHDNRKWDSWGRFVEKSTAYQPWIWTAGNHELDYAPEIGETTPFKPFLHRYATPYEASKSDSPLWYAIKRASVHIIVLSSYSAYGKYTPQYNWLQGELRRVNRSETPWLIVMVHSPWYNSIDYHYMEGETMRVQFESWLVHHKVDIVFSGHVHAYERSERVSNVRFNLTNRLCTPIRDINAPVYITIGDGGNIEGIANTFTDPQPEYSAFREASFGHAVLEIKNRTHAHYTWHRNHDGEPVAADQIWLFNRHWYPEED